MKTEELSAQEKLGARIKLARVNAGLTQDELARKLHIAPQSVGGWERGETSPRGHRLTKLAQLLAVDPTWLLAGPSDTVYPPQALLPARSAERQTPRPAPVIEEPENAGDLLGQVRRECARQGLHGAHYRVPVQAALDPEIDLLHPRVAAQVCAVEGEDWDCKARAKLWGLLLLARMEDLIDLHRTRVLFLCGPPSDATTRLAAEGKLLGNEVLVVPDAQSVCARLLALVG